MRVFVAVLVLIFSLQSWTKADDISDFQIEGMSVGDSALDYFSEQEIENNKQKGQYPNDKYIIRNFHLHENFKTYEMVIIMHLKNDEKYIIAALGGMMFYKNNIKDCFTKKKIIESEFDLIFKNSKKDSGKAKKNFDKTGNSIGHITEYYLKDGSVVQITCDDWSEKMNEENFYDSLNVNLQSFDFLNFLDVAYK